jgi:hypothetical protein
VRSHAPRRRLAARRLERIAVEQTGFEPPVIATVTSPCSGPPPHWPTDALAAIAPRWKFALPSGATAPFFMKM